MAPLILIGCGNQLRSPPRRIPELGTSTRITCRSRSIMRKWMTVAQQDCLKSCVRLSEDSGCWRGTYLEVRRALVEETAFFERSHGVSLRSSLDPNESGTTVASYQ